MEHGPWQTNTKDWYYKQNGRCFDPLHKQEENTKKEDGKQHENQKSDIEQEKKAKRTPKAKHKKEAALTPIATKMATCPLQKTQTKILKEGGQDSVFDRNAPKNEMAVGDESSIATSRTMGKESSWIGTQDLVPKSRRAEGRLRKRWEDEGNDFFKPEETEATNGSDVENNHIWIQVAKQGDKWEEKEDEFAAAGKKEKLTFNE